MLILKFQEVLQFFPGQGYQLKIFLISWKQENRLITFQKIFLELAETRF